MSKVAGPAIGLMVTAGIGIAVHILMICVRLLGIGMMGAMQQESRMPTFMLGTVGIALSTVAILSAVVVLVGAMKMKNLEQYGFAMAASILAMIPCIGPCCLLGIPIGIWALVVLVSPDVKAASRS